MSKIEAFPYKGRKNSFITVSTLEEPYGKGSDSVVSVGCTLKGDTDNPSWKVHIPMDLLERVALALYQRSPAVRAQHMLSDADDRHKEELIKQRLNAELRAVQRMVEDSLEEE